MMSTHLIKYWFIAPLLLSGLLNYSQSTDDQVKQPNIVFIMADDMGYGDISSLNPESKIRTPVLDSMVDEGRNFTQAYASASICTPTRYALLTGRYSFRTGLNGVVTGYSDPLIEKERETIASLLKKAGYSTAVIGKWHLGLEWQPKDTTRPIYTRDAYIPENLNVDYTKPVHGVNEIGFDYSFISPAGNNLAPFTFVENGKVLHQPIEYVEPKIKNHTYRTRRNGGDIAPNYKFDLTLERVTKQAVDYVEEQRGSDRPFFLYFSLTAPHFPWSAHPDFKNNSDIGLYGDFLEEIDARVGEVLLKLEELNLNEETLVIFTSDNGGAPEPWFKEKYDHQMNWGRFGHKHQIWEGGVRIPFIARWDGTIEAGSSTANPISLVDMLATFSGLTGQPFDSTYAEDSFNLSARLLGKGKVIEREAFVNQAMHHEALAIVKDGWKLVPNGVGDSGLESAKQGDPKGMLFNLSKDSLEQQNLYHQYPNKVKELEKLLEKYKRAGKSRNF